MKLKDYSMEELEMMNYADMAEIILSENKGKMKILEIFKSICEALGLSNEQFENSIAEFYEIISTNKKFAILPEGYCDLKTRHNTKIVLEDEEEVVAIDEVEEEEEEDIFYEGNEDDDVNDDGLQDLVIIDEEEDLD